MARTLRFFGLAILAVTTVLLVGSEMGQVPVEFVDSAFRPMALAGGACFLAGVVLGMFSPIGRALTRTRCVRCGAPITKGQTYCADHLRQSVFEAEDEIRGQP